ncbi:MAG TPA: cell division protein FtsZ [Moraxellaceae bacterium]|jgi:cell division protein FtsZ|nr:cell division protein FtsZ [Moraxellaceae bacterium]HQX89251.1 cell division protein FtsZ [Moraxellaceae bacterium]
MAIFELADNVPQHGAAVIKVIGVGGGGGNAVEHMVISQVEGVEFICANTDLQALAKMHARTHLHLGQGITRGLGAGANPEVGRQAAIEDRDRIRDALTGADMVFITAGMGGGTGTGGAPVVAEVAKEMGILTVGVVTKPFLFEGKRRMDVADSGIENLSQYVDSLITIPNHRLQAVLGKVSMIEAFRAANNVLKNAVQGIADMILQPGVINVDFADVRTVMSEQGLAMMGTGSGKGDDRARLATEMAIYSPLLDDIRLDGARGVLVSIAANEDLGLDEYSTVGEIVAQFASPEATVVIGTILDPSLGDELRVTVVATGLPKSAAATASTPMRLVAGQPAPVPAARPAQAATTAATGTSSASYDYDTPAYLRNQKVANGGTAPRSTDANLLNIPAFLRRQAD